MLEFSEYHGAEGWCEMGVRVGGQLQAVITHPCTGGKWVVHFVGQWETKKFKTKKAAVAYVEEALALVFKK